MFTITEISKLAKTTPKALRLYEEKGILSRPSRSQNSYRTYSKKHLEELKSIQLFKNLGFKLEEIKELMILNRNGLQSQIRDQLKNQIKILEVQIVEKQNALTKVNQEILAIEQFYKGRSLPIDKRKVVMESLKNELLNQLKNKINHNHLQVDKYFANESHLYDTPEKEDFWRGVQKVIDFAKKENILLGHPRGPMGASLGLFGMGLNDLNPIASELTPQRINQLRLDFDVEFEKGRRLIDYCHQINLTLSVGRIEAFKLPMLDIIRNCEQKLTRKIELSDFEENVSVLLMELNIGNIDYVFGIDEAPNTQLAKLYEPTWTTGEYQNKLKKFIKRNGVDSFDDLLNQLAVFRPDNQDPVIQDNIKKYKIFKKKMKQYPEFDKEIQNLLKKTFGMILFQEDIIKIIYHYTRWPLTKCEQLRNHFWKGKFPEIEQEFLKIAGEQVYLKLQNENRATFCRAHLYGSWGGLIKKSLYLRVFHSEIYMNEIKNFEAQTGYAWSDIGFINSDGIRLMQ